jgi:outer membrane protein TolC
MSFRKSQILIIILLGYSNFSWSQQNFNERDFLKNIMTNHPVADITNLNIDIENQRLLGLRSAFEPTVNSYYSLKNFDEKQYYSHFNSGMRIQSPIGIGITGGFIENNGVFLNPENNVPISGLVFAGIDVPLGAGLFTDQIRTKVRQQRNNITGAGLIQALDLNDVMYDGGAAFWELYESTQLFNLANEALNLAQQRYNFVKIQATIGEFPLIDTLEALLNFQNRQSHFLDAQMSLIQSQQFILNFIWEEEEQDYNFNLIVDTTLNTDDELLNSMKKLAYEHPYIQLLDIDSINNRLEYRLALEYFKPKIDVVFRIQESGNDFMRRDFNLLENHYIGGRFSIPLLYRSQRAKAAEAKTKADLIGNKKILIVRDIETKYESVLNNTQYLAEMVKIWENASINYRKMLDAENRKFRIGESTLFLVNMREMQWLEGRSTYIKTYTKYRKEVLKAFYTLGILPDIIQ